MKVLNSAENIVENVENPGGYCVKTSVYAYFGRNRANHLDFNEVLLVGVNPVALCRPNAGDDRLLQ